MACRLRCVSRAILRESLDGDRKVMENAIAAALSQQIVLARALDVAANNVANQTTTGFKSERVNFREYISLINGETNGDVSVSLVYDGDSYTDFSAGGLEATHAPLDFAIDGDGFFAVQTEAGVRYTRDGHFGLNTFGELVNRDGSIVLDETGAPIIIDPELGPVLLSQDGELQQDGSPVARLGVYDFDDRRALRREGANLFTTDAEALENGNAQIRQGFVEISNVSPITAMTNMIEILRAYESAAQVLETSNELSRDAVRTLTQNA